MAKEILVDELTSVSKLAELVHEPAKSIIEFGFRNLGLFLTVDQKLTFDQTRIVAEAFGYTAHRRRRF